MCWTCVHNVLNMCTQCIFKIWPTCFWVFPSCWCNAFCFYSQVGLIFLVSFLYVSKIFELILEQLYCYHPMKFCQFFHAHVCIEMICLIICILPYVTQWHFNTGWVMEEFAGLALQWGWFKLWLESDNTISSSGVEFLPEPLVLRSLIFVFSEFMILFIC